MAPNPCLYVCLNSNVLLSLKFAFHKSNFRNPYFIMIPSSRWLWYWDAYSDQLRKFSLHLFNPIKCYFTFQLSVCIYFARYLNGVLNIPNYQVFQRFEVSNTYFGAFGILSKIGYNPKPNKHTKLKSLIHSIGCLACQIVYPWVFTRIRIWKREKQ